MSDLISRQAAIDAFYIQADDDGWWTGTVQDMEEFLNGLPSAQPEIIRCKDCKWKNQHNCTRAVEVWIDDDKFCAWAEMEGAEDERRKTEE